MTPPGGDTSTGNDHVRRVIAAAEDLHVRVRPVRIGTVYGGEKSALEFNLVSGERILIITAWQGVGGTVDHKFPFTYENARLALSQGYHRVFIVLGGKGASGGAVGWLTNAAYDCPGMHVFDSADSFRGACQRYAAYGEWSGID